MMLLPPTPPALVAPASQPASLPAAQAQAAILAAMADSATGWNTGDLDRFMRVYAEDATYVTVRGRVMGRSAISATYRRSFAPGGNARGRLSFGDAAFRSIDAAHVLLWARWTLTTPDAKFSTGMTTLLFERRPGGWRIISDHSS
jgi:uncharacterized protein (TIGR02246 family)